MNSSREMKGCTATSLASSTRCLRGATNYYICGVRLSHMYAYVIPCMTPLVWTECANRTSLELSLFDHVIVWLLTVTNHTSLELSTFDNVIVWLLIVTFYVLIDQSVLLASFISCALSTRSNHTDTDSNSEWY